MEGMKNDLRKLIKQRLAGMGSDAVAAQSRAAAERLISLDVFARAEVVMLYLPIPVEVDTLEIARAGWAAGKKIVAPTACDNCRTMRPIFCRPEDEEMFHPHHGLRQPHRATGEVSIDQIDLLVVPGLGFDRQCNRLGRGGGFYDRFLARPELHAATAGIAFAEQIVENLPIQPNDQPVDMVVTDIEIIRRKADS